MKSNQDYALQRLTELVEETIEAGISETRARLKFRRELFERLDDLEARTLHPHQKSSDALDIIPTDKKFFLKLAFKIVPWVIAAGGLAFTLLKKYILSHP